MGKAQGEEKGKGKVSMGSHGFILLSSLIFSTPFPYAQSAANPTVFLDPGDFAPLGGSEWE